MKNLIKTTEQYEARAKRILFIKKARALEKEAREFRRLAMIEGIKGGFEFKKDHPAYAELIRPLVRQIRDLSLDYQFSYLVTLNTPLPGFPLYSHASAGLIGDSTPTMHALIDIIKARPSEVRKEVEIDLIPHQQLP